MEGIHNDMATGQKLPVNIYGVNGQLVRRGDSSLEGLPGGIHIVNKKKYTVKAGSINEVESYSARYRDSKRKLKRECSGLHDR